MSAPRPPAGEPAVGRATPKPRQADAIPVLEVGGTHVTAAWVSPVDWQTSQVYRTELRAEGTAAELLDGLVAAAATLGAEEGSTWGLAMPGPFDYARGVAHYAGVGKFEGLNGVDVRSELHQALPRQPGSITFINDASAFLIGEWLIGAARGATRCAAVTLGTGVGSAFLDKGTVVDSGQSVPPDAEVHLLSHQGLPLEDWVSRRAIRRAYAAAAGRPDDLDVKEIAQRARDGDRAGLDAFGTAFTVLGEVLGPWLERFGADMLVIGGSVSRSWDLIEVPLRRGLSRHSACRFEIGLAEHPEVAPLVGAAYPAAGPN